MKLYMFDDNNQSDVEHWNYHPTDPLPNIPCYVHNGHGWVYAVMAPSVGAAIASVLLMKLTCNAEREERFRDPPSVVVTTEHERGLLCPKMWRAYESLSPAVVDQDY